MNPLSRTTRTALITGSGKGIGRAIALELSRNGIDIVVHYNTGESGALETANQIQQITGRPVQIVRFDVSNAQQVNQTLKKLEIDILVNNAGVSIDGLLVRTSDESWQKILNTNLTGAFNCSRVCARHMIKQHWGRIINISSVIGQTGNPGQSAYAATKAGLLGFTKSLALELASRQITVNAIAPGWVNTDMTNHLTQTPSIPLGFVAEPEDIAHAVTYLASDRARYITGHTLDINGGLFLN